MHNLSVKKVRVKIFDSFKRAFQRNKSFLKKLLKFFGILNVNDKNCKYISLKLNF